MKNKTKNDLLEIIEHCIDEKKRRKARMYLWKMMEEYTDTELNKCERDGTDVEQEIAKWYLWRRHLDTNLNNLLDIIYNSTDEEHIREAAIIIGNKKYEEAVDDLIGLLCRTENGYIKEGAAIGLRELGDSKAVPFIVEQLKNYTDYSESFVYALENFDCRMFLGLLVDLFIGKPKAFLLRLNILSCVKNQDIKALSEAIRDECVLKLDLAMQVADDEENSGQLEDLYRIIAEV
jgi:hypothetical protein